MNIYLFRHTCFIVFIVRILFITDKTILRYRFYILPPAKGNTAEFVKDISGFELCTLITKKISFVFTLLILNVILWVNWHFVKATSVLYKYTTFIIFKNITLFVVTLSMLRWAVGFIMFLIRQLECYLPLQHTI